MSSSATQAGIDDGLVGYWAFNEGGGGTAQDSSGYDNHGTIHGASYVGGVDGGALSFDGVDDYVNTHIDLSWSSGNSFSVSIWINTREIHGLYGDGIIGKGSAGGYGNANWEWNIDINRNWDLRYVYYEGSHTGIGLYANSEPDAWQHIAVTYNGDARVAMLFVNAILQDTYNVRAGTNFVNRSTPVLIGHSYITQYYNSFYDGILDEARIYNRALSCNDILALYESVFIKEDFNRNGGVDIIDVGILAGEWLQTEDLKADIYPECGDGAVNLLDFVEFARNWMYL